MWHTIFIAVHAVTGGIALLAGCVAIGRRALFGTYLWSLVAMEVFLVLAIAAEWAVIDVAAQVLFAAFALLGLFMLWRADQARRIRPTGSAGPSASYVIAVAGHFVLRAARERLVGSTAGQRGASQTGRAQPGGDAEP